MPSAETDRAAGTPAKTTRSYAGATSNTARGIESKMARCAKCGKQVVAGVVLCSQCYEGAGSASTTAKELQKLAVELDKCAGQAATDIWKLPATLPDTCTKAAAAIRQLLIRAQEAERQRDAAVADLQTFI